MASLREEPCLFVFPPCVGVAGDEQALAAFGLWCEAHAGKRCRIGLSSTWLLHCVLDAGQDAPPARQQALQQWSHYLDVDEASLDQDWVLREVRLPGSGLMCAAPRKLVEGLQQHAKEQGVQIEWMGPWWAYGVQSWLNTLAPQIDQQADLANLHLLEPGLVTHVQAGHLLDQPVTLKRIWCERQAGANQGGHDRCVAIPLSEEANGLSDHASLQPVLTGVDACWKVQA